MPTTKVVGAGLSKSDLTKALAPIVTRLDRIEDQMMVCFEYLVRELHRIEDGRPRAGDQPRVNGPDVRP